MEFPPQLQFDRPDFLASMDCESYPGLHSVPGTVPPDFFINFPPQAPAVFSTHNGSLPIRRLPSAMPCPVIRTNFRHDVIVTAEKYAAKFPQIVEKLEYLPMAWQDLYHFWDPMELYVEDPGFLFHVLHLIIWNAITARRRIYNRVKAWCHLNIHKLVDLTALTPVSSVLDQHDWHFLGLAMIPAHEITMTCAQLDLQRVEMRQMIEQFAKRVLKPAPLSSAEEQLLVVLQQAPDIHDGTFSQASQGDAELDPAVIANHHEHSLGSGSSIASQGSSYVASENVPHGMGYVTTIVTPGSQAMVRQNSQVHAMSAVSSLPQADSKVAGTPGLGQGVLARPQQITQPKSSGYSATKTIAVLRDDTESAIPRVFLPGQTKSSHIVPNPVQDFDIGKMYNAKADWIAAATEKRLIGIRIADAYDTATILKSDVIPKVFSVCGAIESYRPQISDAKMTFVCTTGAHAALKYNGKAIDSGPSLIVYLIPVWDNSITSNFGADNSFENASRGESFHTPVAQELPPQIAGAMHVDVGAPWPASPLAPFASMPYMMSTADGDLQIPLAHRPLPPVPYRVKSVTSPRVPPSNVNRARGQPNPVGHGLNRPRPRPYQQQQGYKQGLLSQYGPRHAQPQSSYQHSFVNHTRFESANDNGHQVRPPTGRNYHTERERQCFATGPSQSNRLQVPKQENIKTSVLSDAVEDLKRADNKDVVVTVTELGTPSEQLAVANVDHPVSGATVLRTAFSGHVNATEKPVSNTFIVETVTVNFVAGNRESSVQSLEAKSGCKITIVPHADPLLQEITGSGSDHNRPPVVDELRRLATEFQDTRDAGNAEAGIQRLLETVTETPTNTTPLMGEHPRSRASIRLQDIEHVPQDSKATMQGSESFEEGIEVSEEDIRGSAAYVQKPRGENHDLAELDGAGTGDWAVLKTNAQTTADAHKGKRAPGNVIEDDNNLSVALADTSAMSNSSQRRKSRNKHGKNASRNDSTVSMASADGSVGLYGNAGRTMDEVEPSEVFYTPDEDSKISNRSKSSVRGPGKWSAKGNKGVNNSAEPNQDSNLSFTSTGGEPGSYAATNDHSEADQRSMPQMTNSQPSSMSMHSTDSTTKRKKKKPRANRKKEPAEDNANLSTTTDGGEGNSNLSFASAADVSAQGSSTSLIHSSDPAADINKAAAWTTPDSRTARGRRTCREDRERNGGHNAVEPPNVPGRLYQLPIPGMSLGNRSAAQTFGGQDSLPMMQSAWSAPGRRDSMTVEGARPGPPNLIPGMTPHANAHVPPALSQTQQQMGAAKSGEKGSMDMAMANAAWKAGLPNSTPGLHPYPTVRLPSSGPHISQSTRAATNTNKGARTTINVSVTSLPIVDTRKQEPISKAWPTVKQWNGRTFQDKTSP